MRKPKAFTIDEEVYNEFKQIAKLNSMNMSLWIENLMKVYIGFNSDEDNVSINFNDPFFKNIKEHVKKNM